MASTIKVDTVTTPDGTGNITFNRPIVADGSNLTNLPAEITKSSSEPTATTNPSSGVGTLWLRTTTGEMYCCTNSTTNDNIWTNIGDGTGLQPETFPVATGGTITTDGSYKVHTFNSSGTFAVSSIGTIRDVEYLAIAGGGGGENGGGGAGGYLTATGLSITAQSYSVTVGAGGARDSAGANSIFSSITATGGGQGGNYSDAGSTGGSGGGGGWNTLNVVMSGGSATASPSQGNAGGNSSGTGYANGGGGGGAGGIGVNGHATNGAGGTGGAGLSSSITGSAVLRGGGGGGGVETSTTQSTASHGGGAGGQGTTGNNAAGTANTGGGGGGGGHSTHVGKAGGSGVVIIRYQFQA